MASVTWHQRQGYTHLGSELRAASQPVVAKSSGASALLRPLSCAQPKPDHTVCPSVTLELKGLVAKKVAEGGVTLSDAACCNHFRGSRSGKSG